MARTLISAELLDADRPSNAAPDDVDGLRSSGRLEMVTVVCFSNTPGSLVEVQRSS